MDHDRENYYQPLKMHFIITIIWEQYGAELCNSSGNQRVLSTFVILCPNNVVIIQYDITMDELISIISCSY